MISLYNKLQSKIQFCILSNQKCLYPPSLQSVFQIWDVSCKNGLVCQRNLEFVSIIYNIIHIIWFSTVFPGLNINNYWWLKRPVERFHRYGDSYYLAHQECHNFWLINAKSVLYWLFCDGLKWCAVVYIPTSRKSP